MDRPAIAFRRRPGVPSATSSDAAESENKRNQAIMALGKVRGMIALASLIAAGMPALGAGSRTGQLLTLQPGIAHGLAAEAECAFLLTIAGGKAHAAE